MASPRPIGSARQHEPRIAPFDLPPWIKNLQTWWQDTANSPSSPPSDLPSATIPAGEAQAALQLLSAALGDQVVLAGIPGMPHGVLQLKCSARCKAYVQQGLCLGTAGDDKRIPWTLRHP